MTSFEKDLIKHLEIFNTYMELIIQHLKVRAELHDKSKYSDEEKPQFEKVSCIKREDFNTYEEWLNATKPLLESALQHHYKFNRHHPEHYTNGIDDMTLVDLMEMLCDWKSSAECRNTELDLDYSIKRFNISPQLQSILKNTKREYLD